MQETIELTIESADGPVDCQVDRNEADGHTEWSVVVLYPHIENGILRSKVYDHALVHDQQTGTYSFSPGAAIHPKVKQLEQQLSAAIINSSK